MAPLLGPRPKLLPSICAKQKTPVGLVQFSQAHDTRWTRGTQIYRSAGLFTITSDSMSEPAIEKWWVDLWAAQRTQPTYSNRQTIAALSYPVEYRQTTKTCYAVSPAKGPTNIAAASDAVWTHTDINVKNPAVDLRYFKWT